MPATTFGTVYSTGSKMVRRIILPDDDKELLNGNHVGPGETMLVSPMRYSLGLPLDPHDLATCKSLVKQATGVTPPDASCAVVDQTNTVVAVIMADPAIDAHSAGQLIHCYSPAIGIGCTYDPITKLFSAPGRVVLAGGVDKTTGLPIIQDITVLPAVIPNVVVAAP